MALNPKRAAFIREYLIDLNATQAAIRAGYSPKAAKVTGHRLLTDANVAEAVQVAQRELSQVALVTAHDVVKGLRREAEEADSASARVAAWAHLGKHLGMFTEKVENTHKFDGIVGIKVNMPPTE